MKVHVIMFGPYADAVGAGEVECDLPNRGRTTVEEIIEALGRSQPALRSMLPAARIAVNQQFAGLEQAISESDKVALIGLVSGG